MKKQKKSIEGRRDSKSAVEVRLIETPVVAPAVVAASLPAPTLPAPTLPAPTVAPGGPVLSEFALRCQELYQAARTPRADGCIQLDRERLARALADTGIGSRAEQALYSLAILAAADGDLSLFQDDVIAALQKAS